MTTTQQTKFAYWRRAIRIGPVLIRIPNKKDLDRVMEKIFRADLFLKSPEFYIQNHKWYIKKEDK